jgi:L-ascorbate metabolism protein UlaG (beta-lactamase superfamily)
VEDTGMVLNSRINVVSPQGELTPFGVRPNIRPFRIAAIFETGFYEIDDNWVFTSIEAAQKALSLQDVINQIELKVDDQILVIDPYFTRIPFRRMWFGRIRPDGSLSAEQVPRCDFILVTHSHWDHLLDVPDVAHNTSATVLGSPNTCRLLVASGVPEEQIRLIGTGDSLALGSFQVEVLPAEHGKIPLDKLFNGPLSAHLRPPLRAWDCRMDSCLAFLIQAGEQRVLVGAAEYPEQGTTPDILFVGVTYSPARYRSLLQRARPPVVVPIHWDDMFRPLSKPIRPMLQPPAWAIPPLQRVNLAGFSQMIEQMAPGTKVIIPELFRLYNLIL